MLNLLTEKEIIALLACVAIQFSALFYWVMLTLRKSEHRLEVEKLKNKFNELQIEYLTFIKKSNEELKILTNTMKERKDDRG